MGLVDRSLLNSMSWRRGSPAPVPTDMFMNLRRCCKGGGRQCSMFPCRSFAQKGLFEQGLSHRCMFSPIPGGPGAAPQAPSVAQLPNQGPPCRKRRNLDARFGVPEHLVVDKKGNPVKPYLANGDSNPNFTRISNDIGRKQASAAKVCSSACSSHCNAWCCQRIGA